MSARMDQKALLEKYEADKKAKQVADERERKREARIAKQKKVRADQKARVREKREEAERKKREAREREERLRREKEEATSFHFVVERDVTGHFPELEHKVKILAAGFTMKQVYANMRYKLKIHREDFVVTLMDKKTFEFTELDDIHSIRYGKRYERRARIIRRQDVWFPDNVNDKTLCCLCGDEIGSCRRRFHHGNISHKASGVETQALSSAPLPPDCRNYRDALRYHLSKYRPETRTQICGACYAFNLMQLHRYNNRKATIFKLWCNRALAVPLLRESVLYEDHPYNALDPWGPHPATAEGQHWHYNLDPAAYRLRHVMAPGEQARRERRLERDRKIREWEQNREARRAEALRRCGLAGGGAELALQGEEDALQGGAEEEAPLVGGDRNRPRARRGDSSPQTGQRYRHQQLGLEQGDSFEYSYGIEHVSPVPALVLSSSSSY